MKKIRFTHYFIIGLVLSVSFIGLVLMRMPAQVLIFAAVLTVLIFLGLLGNQGDRITQTELAAIQHVNEVSESALVTLLEQMPIGVIKLDEATHEVEWFNPYAALLFTEENGEVNKDKLQIILKAGFDQTARQVTIEDQQYTVYVAANQTLLYFFEIQMLLQGQSQENRQWPVIGIISIDNYDDLEDSLSESSISQVNVFLADCVSQFAKEYQIFSRRVATDRFYIFTDYAVLKKLMDEKFPVLKQFKTAAASKDLSLTLSMGIAYGQENHHQIGQIALRNLNMAEVRGGDQVVVQGDDERQKPLFFGGNTASSVKRTRTRTRAMTAAISDKIKTVDQVFVVGHCHLDMDALGASVGMQYFATHLTEKAYMVYDPEDMSSDISRAVYRLKEEDTGQLLPVSSALDLVTDDSLLIMVDHSKTSLTLSKAFYDKFSQVIVVDHHRRDTDFPENAVITYIESGASSASELVTELIQFQNGRKTHLSKLQASLLMAGIMLDTKNFSSRVTSRTFDVASYLRRRGSDSLEIQTISATDFDEYKAVNEIVLKGQRVLPNVIVSQADETKVYDNVETSKAADTILQMAGVEASFVLTKSEQGTISISARSRGKINVQAIMEEMGGGGHFNLAACQLRDVSLPDAYAQLLEKINANIGKQL